MNKFCTVCCCDLPCTSENSQTKCERGDHQSLLAFLRLVNISVENTLDDKTNNLNNLKLADDISFCDSCQRRNFDIRQLFLQIDNLQCQMQEFKRSIHRDFINSFYLTTNHSNNHDEYDDYVERKPTKSSLHINNEIHVNLSSIEIRNILAQKLQLSSHEEPNVYNHKDYFVDDPCEPTFFEDTAFPTKPKIKSICRAANSYCNTLQSSFENTSYSDSTIMHLRQHNITKDVVIQIEKLPTSKYNHLISNKAVGKRKVRRKNYQKTNPDENYKNSTTIKRIPRRGNHLLICPYPDCSKKFTTQEHLDFHGMKTHEGISHPYYCSTCGKRFRLKKSHSVHMRIHNGEYIYKCTFQDCLKAFTKKADLQSHARRHSSETPFKCKEENCGRAFKAHGGLVYHTRKEHTGIFPYTCEFCGVSFVRSDKLKRHKDSVHNLEKNIVCHICGKAFAIRNYLYMHLRVHEGRPFKSNRKKKSIKSGDEKSNNEIQQELTTCQSTISTSPHEIPYNQSLDNTIVPTNNNESRPQTLQIGPNSTPFLSEVPSSQLNFEYFRNIPNENVKYL